jgi:hypothetical protein
MKLLPEVFHIGDSNGGVVHAVVDNSVHSHCHAVTGQDLKSWRRDVRRYTVGYLVMTRVCHGIYTINWQMCHVVDVK